MSDFPFLHTETLQLVELQLQDFVNTPLDARFNRLARITREALGVRAAAISFVDHDREWFKAVTGWNVTELPRARSLAGALLGSGAPSIVPDTLDDERCRSHPLVSGAPGFRFCAVYPLLDRFDNPLGAVAGYDIEPHRASPRLIETLRDVGELAQRELFLNEAGTAQQQLLAKLDASRRQALLDELTRLWNRRGGLELLGRALAGAQRSAGLGVCIVDIDHFKAINDQHGHAAGDAVLRRVASLLVDSIRPTDIACRYGGDEFLLVVPDVSAEQFGRIVERVRSRTESLTVPVRGGSIVVTLSLGGISAGPRSGLAADELVHRADEALYRAKGEGRNRTVVDEAA